MASGVTRLFCPLPSRTAWAAHLAAGCGIDPNCLAAGGARPYQGATTCGQARAGMWGASGHKAYFVWCIYPLDICTQTWVLFPLLSWCVFTWKQFLLFWFLFGCNVCDLSDLSSPTRDRTYALGSESMGSSPLDHEGVPEVIFVWFWFFFLIPLIPLPLCRTNHNSGCFLPFQAPGSCSSSHCRIFFLANEPVSLNVTSFYPLLSLSHHLFIMIIP